MKLEKYLKIYKIKVADFAKMTELHPATIYCYLRGQYPPRPAMARKIEKVTGGMVKIQDLYK